MLNSLRFVNCARVALLVLFCAQAYAKDAELLSLSMEHFRDTATVLDNAQDAVATITTQNGFSEKRGPMRAVWNDEYLVGTIDKKTGAKLFQVYVWITYVGGERAYRNVSFQTPSGPKSVAATVLETKKEYCLVGDCTYTERLTFPVDEDLLRKLADERSTATPTLWPFHVTAKSGPAYSRGLSTAEIAGFLARVDSYPASLPVVVASVTRAALELDLGIEGLPVAATTQQPNRAGILIVGVSSGSVADKSGLIIGDILYQMDGHPLKTLAELQKAVAGCVANSLVPVKLYRGLMDTQIAARF
jgi:hypothetical protein